MEVQIKELLERVTQLEAQIANQSSLFERFLKTFSKLEHKVVFNGKALCKLWDAHIEQRDAVSSRFEDAFERIKGLERTVFPNLGKDLESVWGIVGGDGVPEKPNPLDIRKK